mmetsp:Transcript_16114/g.21299  ORF Transcript_16114/g.21299 Transcript_16114/m.21299 type:complete len:313 (-) Transcript_16114:1929-2867(-)
MFGNFGRDAEIKPKAGAAPTKAHSHEIPELAALRRSRELQNAGGATRSTSRHSTGSSGYISNNRPDNMSRMHSSGSMSSQGAEDKGKGLFGTIVDSFKIFEDTEPRATSPSSAESFRSGGSPQQYSQSASAKRSPTENYRSQRSSPQDYRDQYRQQQQPGSFFNRSSPGITNSRGYNIEEDLRETQKQLQIERNQREQLEHSMKMMQELLKRKDEESEGDFMEKLHHLRIQEARKTKAVLEMHRIWSNNPTGDGDGGAGSLFSKSSSKKKKETNQKNVFYQEKCELLRPSCISTGTVSSFWRRYVQESSCYA